MPLNTGIPGWHQKHPLIFNNQDKPSGAGYCYYWWNHATSYHWKERQERIVTVTCVAAKGAVLSDLVEAAGQQIENRYSFRCHDRHCRQLRRSAGIVSRIWPCLWCWSSYWYIYCNGRLSWIIYQSVHNHVLRSFALTGVCWRAGRIRDRLGIMTWWAWWCCSGIVVKNGIVPIDYIVLCRGRGMSVMDAM